MLLVLECKVRHLFQQQIWQTGPKFSATLTDL